MEPSKPLASAEVEALLTRLKGIHACRIICNDWGAIEEIHVLSDTDHHPKQIVRDIESALAAQWKARIDHKKISVAQLQAATPSQQVTQSTGARPFVSLAQLNIASYPGESRQEVVLKLQNGNGRSSEGRVQSAYSLPHSGRTPAQAAVEAVNDLLAPGYSIHLEDMAFLQMSGAEVVVCQLCLSRPRGDTQVLAGAAPLQNNDRALAAIQSVLLAVNGSLEDAIASE